MMWVGSWLSWQGLGEASPGGMMSVSTWWPATGQGRTGFHQAHWQDRLELPAATRHHFLFAWETGTYLIPSDSTSSSYLCSFSNEKLKTLFPPYSSHAKEPEPFREADSRSEAGDVGGSGPR